VTGRRGKEFDTEGEGGEEDMKEEETERADVWWWVWFTWLDSAVGGIEEGIDSEVIEEREEIAVVEDVAEESEVVVAGMSSWTREDEVVEGGRAGEKIDLKTGEREYGRWEPEGWEKEGRLVME
jgi:hypothetical protein